MPYGIPYDSPATLPVAVLVVYLVLLISKVISRYAKTLPQEERLQQEDSTISSKASFSENPSAGNKGESELF